MDSISATIIKAIEEMSGMIFIPGLICSLFVEVGPNIQELTGLSFWTTYLIVAVSGFFLSLAILFLLLELSILILRGKDISDIIGLLIMPLGFAGIFHQYFVGIDIPYTQVTGVAILAWSFMLVRDSTFINNLREFT